MELTSMRFKTFTWPHNPQTYSINYHRSVVTHKIPFGRYHLQDLGLTRRVMKGVGEFTGEGAYDTFRELASLFYEESPGVLVHPLWQTTMAWFVGLELEQEPKKNYVRYSFEFWECGESEANSAALLEADEGEGWHTVLEGETLWIIAGRYGTTVEELLALNPTLKNPNLIAPGDQIRVKE